MFELFKFERDLDDTCHMYVSLSLMRSYYKLTGLSSTIEEK